MTPTLEPRSIYDANTEIAKTCNLDKMEPVIPVLPDEAKPHFDELLEHRLFNNGEPHPIERRKRIINILWDKWASNPRAALSMTGREIAKKLGSPIHGSDATSQVRGDIDFIRDKILAPYNREFSNAPIRFDIPDAGDKKYRLSVTRNVVTPSIVLPTDLDVSSRGWGAAPSLLQNSDMESPLDIAWIHRLNRYLRREVEVYKILKREPILVERDPKRLEPLEDSTKKNVAASLEFNDQVGLLYEEPAVNDNEIIIYIYRSQYAEVKALEMLDKERKLNTGRRPTQVSGDALLVCPERECIVLHRRSSQNDSYSGALHAFGGTYSPRYDHLSLIATARRETLQESDICFEASSKHTLLLVREWNIHFLALAILGVAVSKDRVNEKLVTSEGSVTTVAFSDLEQKLAEESAKTPDGTATWHLTGKAYILSWLALGAPVAADIPPSIFNKDKARRLFNKVVGTP